MTLTISAVFSTHVGSEVVVLRVWFWGCGIRGCDSEGGVSEGVVFGGVIFEGVVFDSWVSRGWLSKGYVFGGVVSEGRVGINNYGLLQRVLLFPFQWKAKLPRWFFGAVITSCWFTCWVFLVLFHHPLQQSITADFPSGWSWGLWDHV